MVNVSELLYFGFIAYEISNIEVYQTTNVNVVIQPWHLAGPQLKANTAGNESLYSSVCWTLAYSITAVKDQRFTVCCSFQIDFPLNIIKNNVFE